MSASSLPTLLNYIDGEFRSAISSETILDFDPASGLPSATIPRSSSADIDLAVASARTAFSTWSKTPFATRAAYLDAIANEIERRAPEIAELEARDAGKTLKMATMTDIPRSVANLRFFAGAIRHDETAAHMMADGSVNYAMRVPIGVAGLITPWNLPLYLLTWKVAPALACGNTVVAKPSEITPRTASILAEIAHAVGLPKGVLNIVHGLGSEAGAALVSHQDVKCVSFTGGTATGALVAKATAPLFKKVSLELGGKNSTIIFADYDLDKAVAAALRAGFTNNGQVCLCGSRVLVHKSLYPAFLPAFAAAVAKLKVGGPLDPTTDVGPVSCVLHYEKILSYIRLATEEGGKIESGGLERPEGLSGEYEKGFFIRPTVVSGLSYSSRCSTEEVFGPFVTVHPFEDEAEAIHIANNTRYGLACSIWTNNLGAAHRVAQQIEVGIVWVNCWLQRDLRTPFGGIKDSGVGREGGKYSLDFYTEYKNVCVNPNL
jgi:aminomuconate-semialdehyde/2-hydroxymuconate-6-semialdehyde dehydrogenase